MKRIVCLILIAVLCCIGSAFAESAVQPAGVTRDSEYFAYYGTSITPIGDGLLDITFSAGSVGIASQLGVSSFQIQEYVDGAGWVDVTGLLEGEWGYDCSSYSFAVLFYGVEDEIYRVTCSFLSTKYNGTTETKSYTSRSVRAL